MFLTVLLVVGGSRCAGPRLNPDGTPEVDASNERQISDEVIGQARQFDQYLRKEFDARTHQEYEATCNENPSQNVFCYSVIHRERFEMRASAKRQESMVRRGRIQAVVPRYKKRKLINWVELRFSSISSLLRGLNSVDYSGMMVLKDLALKEKKCPNNIALAVAAHLEDFLPDKIRAIDLAKLYERGAYCLLEDPVSREPFLTRAGLFYFSDKQYSRAHEIFEKSSALPGAYVGRPLYWLYRAKGVLGKTEEAEGVLRQLREKYPFSFHTLVAVTAKAEDPGTLLERSPAHFRNRSESVPTINVLIEQVEILSALKLTDAARRVLDWTLTYSEGVEPELMVYLAELKRNQGDYLGKISILSDVLFRHPTLISRNTLELYFPKVFFPIFSKHANGLDPYLLVSMARRESAFNPRAISSANARGLLQVTPQTGRLFTNNLNLLDPNVNVDVGAKYFIELMKKLNGQVHLALAAYNAGPHKVSAWANRYPVEDPILFTDLIPYRETRDYVAAILRNYYWYRRIHDDKTPNTTDQLLSVSSGN